MLRMALTIVQVFSSVAIVALVLLQRGKGADAGAGFGAGASGTVFGARGARTALSRATAVFAAVFMLNSLALAYMGKQQAVAQPKTILDEAAGTSPSNAPPAPSGVQKTPSVPAPASGAPAQAPAPAGIPAPANGPQENGSPPK
jgi:preprotein translocase subunit SecG